MFISFEGIDGSGKSTQISLLDQYLSSQGHKVHVFREPGGTEISERIRSILLDEKSEISPVTELLLFSSARSQLIAEKVLPILQKQEVVILDRFYDSTIAYQGFGRKSFSIDQIHQINKIASHGLVPELTFYLRLSIEESKRRRANMEEDRMEQSGNEFFARVIEGFEYLAKTEERFKTIEAIGEVESIHAEIINHIVARYSL